MNTLVKLAFDDAMSCQEHLNDAFTQASENGDSNASALQDAVNKLNEFLSRLNPLVAAMPEATSQDTKGVKK